MKVLILSSTERTIGLSCKATPPPPPPRRVGPKKVCNASKNVFEAVRSSLPAAYIAPHALLKSHFRLLKHTVLTHQTSAAVLQLRQPADSGQFFHLKQAC